MPLNGTYTHVPRELEGSPEHWEREAISAYKQGDAAQAQAAAMIALAQRVDELRETLDLMNPQTRYELADEPEDEPLDLPQSAGEVH